MQARPYRPVVNRGHPLARGLLFDVPFLEGGGLSVLDVAGGRAGTISRYQPAVHCVEMYRNTLHVGRYAAGAAEFFIGGDGFTKDRIYWGPVAERSGRLPCSCFALGNFTDVTANQVIFQSGGHLGNSAINDCQYRIQIAGGRAYTTRSDGTSTDFVQSASVIAAGVHAIAATYDGSTLSLFWDGKPEGSVASSTTANSGASGGAQVSGVNLDGSGNVPYQLRSNNDVAVVRTWARALSPAEIQAVSADPWAIYRPTRQARLFTAPVALAGGGQRGWLFPPLGLPLGLPVGVRA